LGTGKQNRSCLGDWYQWEGRGYKKTVQEVNMVEMLCTHVCKWEMRPAETTSGMGVETKENEGGVNFIMIYCKDFCKFLYPQYNNKINK
jgi:hypothetical protein